MPDVLYLKKPNIPVQGKPRLGECLKSQRIWMIMKLKDLEDKFEIRFINEKTMETDPEFKELEATTPFLRHQEIEYQDVNEIAYHLEKHFPDPSLDTRDVEANGLGHRGTPLTWGLAGWIKNTEARREEFCIERFYRTLGEIDHILGKKFAEFGGPFICGPKLMFPDCMLLPKLNHLKVAILYTKGYDFTKSGGPGGGQKLENIVKYLEAAEKIPAFTETCPPDEEIQDKWRAYRK